MDKQIVSTSESPNVFITAQGNLHVKGTDDLEVVARSDSPEDLSLQQAGDEVRIDCSSNCVIRVPRQASVTIGEAKANVGMKAVEGAIRVGEVSGDLELRSLGSVGVELVHGNLTAKNISGPFKIGSVRGNALVRDVLGPFTVEERVSGNLKLDDLEDSASAEVDGNITVRLDPQPGQVYRFEAEGNILCRLSSDASVKVVVDQAARVAANLRGEFEVTRMEEGVGPTHMVLGEGDAQMSLSAGGTINLTSQAPDWEMADDFDADVSAEFEGMAEELSEQVARQVASQMEILERQLEEQMGQLNSMMGATGLSKEAAERISQRAREASARATIRAQEKMQQAQERIQRKMEAAQRKAEQKARRAERRAEQHAQRREHRSWGFEWPAQPSPAEAPDAGASDEERMMILNMLQEKKITAEEAEKLLSALEGPGD